MGSLRSCLHTGASPEEHRQVPAPHHPPCPGQRGQPSPSTDLCLHLPWILGQPLDRTRSYLDSWRGSLAFILSQKVGCKFTAFFDKIAITQMSFCLCLTSCKSLLFQHIPTAALLVPRFVPARRCGLFVLLFPVKSIFFFLIST